MSKPKKTSTVFGIPHHNDLVTLDASNSRKQNRQDFLHIIWIHNSENPKRRSFPTNNIWVHILHSFPETSHQKCNFCWRCKTFEFWNFQLVGSILKENLKSRLRFSELSFFLRCRCNLVQSVLLLQQERCWHCGDAGAFNKKLASLASTDSSRCIAVPNAML